MCGPKQLQNPKITTETIKQNDYNKHENGDRSALAWVRFFSASRIRRHNVENELSEIFYENHYTCQVALVTGKRHQDFSQSSYQSFDLQSQGTGLACSKWQSSYNVRICVYSCPHTKYQRLSRTSAESYESSFLEQHRYFMFCISMLVISSRICKLASRICHPVPFTTLFSPNTWPSKGRIQILELFEASHEKFRELLYDRAPLFPSLSSLPWPPRLAFNLFKSLRTSTSCSESLWDSTTLRKFRITFAPVLKSFWSRASICNEGDFPLFSCSSATRMSQLKTSSGMFRKYINPGAPSAFPQVSTMHYVKIEIPCSFLMVAWMYIHSTFTSTPYLDFSGSCR